MRNRRLVHLSLVAILATVATACAGSGPSPSPTPPAPPPAPTQSPPPVPSPTFTPVPFSLEVSPPDEPAASRMAIPGSRYCFLVVVRDAGADPAPVAITAAAEKAKVLSIQPATLATGTVGEVCVAADPTDVETTGSVTITATRGETTRVEERSLPVFPMLDERSADARPHFERWVAWLAAERPELGITPGTTWEPVFVSTLLVVSHYSYWSEDWEMTVAWHNMIPPYDWTEVHLRRRGVDAAPTIAFRMDSVSGATDPHEVDPPEAVVR